VLSGILPSPAIIAPTEEVNMKLANFTAAADAFVSVGYRNEDFVDSALKDCFTLVRLELGRHPELGAPVDPSPGRPLGPCDRRPSEMPSQEAV
jgi:hypothetical protein